MALNHPPFFAVHFRLYGMEGMARLHLGWCDGDTLLPGPRNTIYLGRALSSCNGYLEFAREAIFPHLINNNCFYYLDPLAHPDPPPNPSFKSGRFAASNPVVTGWAAEIAACNFFEPSFVCPWSGSPLGVPKQFPTLVQLSVRRSSSPTAKRWC